jgi:hypothetical protein
MLLSKQGFLEAKRLLWGERRFNGWRLEGLFPTQNDGSN